MLSATQTIPLAAKIFLALRRCKYVKFAGHTTASFFLFIIFGLLELLAASVG
jgi:hypothetical protein